MSSSLDTSERALRAAVRKSTAIGSNPSPGLALNTAGNHGMEKHSNKKTPVGSRKSNRKRVLSLPGRSSKGLAGLKAEMCSSLDTSERALRAAVRKSTAIGSNPSPGLALNTAGNHGIEKHGNKKTPVGSRKSNRKRVLRPPVRSSKRLLGLKAAMSSSLDTSERALRTAVRKSTAIGANPSPGLALNTAGNHGIEKHGNKKTPVGSRKSNRKRVLSPPGRSSKRLLGLKAEMSSSLDTSERALRTAVRKSTAIGANPSLGLALNTAGIHGIGKHSNKKTPVSSRKSNRKRFLGPPGLSSKRLSGLKAEISSSLDKSERALRAAVRKSTAIGANPSPGLVLNTAGNQGIEKHSNKKTPVSSKKSNRKRMLSPPGRSSKRLAGLKAEMWSSLDISERALRVAVRKSTAIGSNPSSGLALNTAGSHGMEKHSNKKAPVSSGKSNRKRVLSPPGRSSERLSGLKAEMSSSLDMSERALRAAVRKSTAIGANPSPGLALDTAGNRGMAQQLEAEPASAVEEAPSNIEPSSKNEKPLDHQAVMELQLGRPTAAHEMLPLEAEPRIETANHASKNEPTSSNIKPFNKNGEPREHHATPELQQSRQETEKVDGEKPGLQEDQTLYPFETEPRIETANDASIDEPALSDMEPFNENGKSQGHHATPELQQSGQETDKVDGEKPGSQEDQTLYAFEAEPRIETANDASINEPASSNMEPFYENRRSQEHHATTELRQSRQETEKVDGEKPGSQEQTLYPFEAEPRIEIANDASLNEPALSNMEPFNENGKSQEHHASLELQQSGRETDKVDGEKPGSQEQTLYPFETEPKIETANDASINEPASSNMEPFNENGKSQEHHATPELQQSRQETDKLDGEKPGSQEQTLYPFEAEPRTETANHASLNGPDSSNIEPFNENGNPQEHDATPELQQSRQETDGVDGEKPGSQDEQTLYPFDAELRIETANDASINEPASSNMEPFDENGKSQEQHATPELQQSRQETDRVDGEKPGSQEEQTSYPFDAELRIETANDASINEPSSSNIEPFNENGKSQEQHATPELQQSRQETDQVDGEKPGSQEQTLYPFEADLRTETASHASLNEPASSNIEQFIKIGKPQEHDATPELQASRQEMDGVDGKKPESQDEQTLYPFKADPRMDTANHPDFINEPVSSNMEHFNENGNPQEHHATPELHQSRQATDEVEGEKPGSQDEQALYSFEDDPCLEFAFKTIAEDNLEIQDYFQQLDDSHTEGDTCFGLPEFCPLNMFQNDVSSHFDMMEKHAPVQQLPENLTFLPPGNVSLPNCSDIGPQQPSLEGENKECKAKVN